MSIWRPFDDHSDDERHYEITEETVISSNTSTQSKNKERTNIRVGEKEKEIVMEAYLHNGEKNWKGVLLETRENISKVPMNSKLVQFYLEEEEVKVLRRMKRIVREETKIQALLYHKRQEQQSTQSKSRGKRDNYITVSDSEGHSDNKIAVSGMKAKQRPDKKQQEKRQGMKELSEQPRKIHGAEAVVERQMRYAVKKTPEEKMKLKFSSFADSDESEDSDETKQPVKKKRPSTLREVSYEAQTAHKSMCEKASSSLEMMNNVFKKLDQKLDEF